MRIRDYCGTSACVDWFGTIYSRGAFSCEISPRFIMVRLFYWGSFFQVLYLFVCWQLWIVRISYIGEMDGDKSLKSVFYEGLWWNSLISIYAEAFLADVEDVCVCVRCLIKGRFCGFLHIDLNHISLIGGHLNYNKKRSESLCFKIIKTQSTKWKQSTH